MATCPADAAPATDAAGPAILPNRNPHRGRDLVPAGVSTGTHLQGCREGAPARLHPCRSGGKWIAGHRNGHGMGMALGMAAFQLAGSGAGCMSLSSWRVGTSRSNTRWADGRCHRLAGLAAGLRSELPHRKGPGAWPERCAPDTSRSQARETMVSASARKPRRTMITLALVVWFSNRSIVRRSLLCSDRPWDRCR